jgi:hypothetical protein
MVPSPSRKSPGPWLNFSLTLRDVVIKRRLGFAARRRLIWAIPATEGKIRKALSDFLRQRACGTSPMTVALTLFLPALLGGCVESALPDVATSYAGSSAHGSGLRPSASPRGASVALASLTGVPEAVEYRMRDAFSAEAAQKDITVSDSQKAAYLLRGYVTSYPVEKGVAVTVVYDVFDAKKKRARRLENGVIVQSAQADPWPGFDDAAISGLAAKSADDLAAFLAMTPEAAAFAARAALAAPDRQPQTDQTPKPQFSTRPPQLDPEGAPTSAPRARSTDAALTSGGSGFSMAALR